jgi:hypothetical protein
MKFRKNPTIPKSTGFGIPNHHIASPIEMPRPALIRVMVKR